ncbi:hypothetical protein [Moorena producens]
MSSVYHIYEVHSHVLLLLSTLYSLISAPCSFRVAWPTASVPAP